MTAVTRPARRGAVASSTTSGTNRYRTPHGNLGESCRPFRFAPFTRPGKATSRAALCHRHLRAARSAGRKESTGTIINLETRSEMTLADVSEAPSPPPAPCTHPRRRHRPASRASALARPHGSPLPMRSHRHETRRTRRSRCASSRPSRWPSPTAKDAKIRTAPSSISSRDRR